MTHVLITGLVIAVIVFGTISITWALMFGRTYTMRPPRDTGQQSAPRPGDDDQFGTWPSVRVPDTGRRPSTPDTLRHHEAPLAVVDVRAPELHLCIDEDCPSCGWPERWFSPAFQLFGCPTCSYTSTERTS